jgi:putative endonuclease
VKTGIQIVHGKATSRLHFGEQAKRYAYIGVTNNLVERVWQHKNEMTEGFSKKYAVHKLVYYELHRDMVAAITREKQLKKWNRAWKL